MNRWCALTPRGWAAVTIVSIEGDLSGLPLHATDGRRVAWPEPGRVRRARLGQPGCPLDEALIVGREQGAELHLHGGPGVAAGVTAWLEQCGLRPDPIGALPAPSSMRLARALLSTRDGPLAALERNVRAGVGGDGRDPELASRLRAVLALTGFAERLLQPARVRLVGEPNAGKSTLFNALLGSKRALTSPRAGTTRDEVAARLALRGVPVLLVDTAGGAASGAADLDVHVLIDPDETPRPDTLVVLGRADLRPSVARHTRVSGLCGEGVSALAESIADGLGIPRDRSLDILAPVDATQRSAFEQGLDPAGYPRCGPG